MNVEKNPDKCKNSFLFGNVYICKIQTVPCQSLNKCALETLNILTESLAALIDSIAEPPKKKENDDA